MRNSKKILFKTQFYNPSTYEQFLNKLKLKDSFLSEIKINYGTSLKEQKKIETYQFQHIRQIFKENEKDLSSEQLIIKKEVYDKFPSYSTTSNPPYFSLLQITETISKLKNSIVPGYDSLNYSHIKKKYSFSIDNNSKEDKKMRYHYHFFMTSNKGCFAYIKLKKDEKKFVKQIMRSKDLNKKID
ncbi:hypothetical protein BpHYR1_029283 [Brachionus plicatilis]|uniref:Uncharacterized protein n=1 Tax=Brachionus plicatilis TaxID=10195 RepID=A0A3M7PWQ1_BRAPC|nr:hypothetical protein BpHYR1_029283 [Brachionus plicatilis]